MLDKTYDDTGSDTDRIAPLFANDPARSRYCAAGPTDQSQHQRSLAANGMGTEPTREELPLPNGWSLVFETAMLEAGGIRIVRIHNDRRREATHIVTQLHSENELHEFLEADEFRAGYRAFFDQVERKALSKLLTCTNL